MLAQIASVKNIISIDFAQNVELMKVLNYQVVVPRNIFHVDDHMDDLVIYFALGSILDKDYFTYQDWHPKKEGKFDSLDVSLVELKCYRFGKKSYWSEGFVAPLSWLRHYIDIEKNPVKLGDDVTQIMKVKQGQGILHVFFIKLVVLKDDLFLFEILSS